MIPDIATTTHHLRFSGVMAGLTPGEAIPGPRPGAWTVSSLGTLAG